MLEFEKLWEAWEEMLENLSPAAKHKFRYIALYPETREKYTQEWEHLSQSFQSMIYVNYLIDHKPIFLSTNYATFWPADDPELMNDFENVMIRMRENDFLRFFNAKILFFRYLMELEDDNIENYKLISEYAIKKSSTSFVRLSQQACFVKIHQDSDDIYLFMMQSSVATNQNLDLDAEVYLFNTQTGEIITVESLEESSFWNLTEREQEIYSLVNKKCKSHEIAEKLHISIHTVYTHRKRIREKIAKKHV